MEAKHQLKVKQSTFKEPETQILKKQPRETLQSIIQDTEFQETTL